MRIQCPECSQRFDITEDLLGKTVECGSCDARFKVTEDRLVSQRKKFYPGEKRLSHLERFGRTAASRVETKFQKAHYKPDVDPSWVGPPRPRRLIATVCGLLLMVMVIMAFVLMGGEEGPMRDMVTQNRFILCGFTALLGSILVIYGMVGKRLMGVVVALLGSLLLLSMPVIFPANPVGVSSVDVPDDQDALGGSTPSNELWTEQDYLFEIGYDPVEEAIRMNSKDTVIAVFLRNAAPKWREVINNYLYESTGKKNRGTSYDRGDDYMMGLILMVGQTESIEEIAALCTKFGRIEKISKELRVIDVVVDHESLAPLDQGDALDPNSLSFEAQNLKALHSIDAKVRMNAVKRLATAEPRALRDDITQKLSGLLAESTAEQQLEIIRALNTWAVPGSGVKHSVQAAVKTIHEKGKVDRQVMAFLIKFEIDAAGEILLDLWKKDPVSWSEFFVQMGEGAQILLLPELDKMDTPHIISASGILGKVATESGITYIERVIEKKEGQSKKSLQAAVDEIKSRF